MRLVDDYGAVLDAVFDLEPAAHGVDIILHSRSGGTGSARSRNPDYFKTLELLLVRLATLDARITSVRVDSSVARRLPVDERTINLDYPLRPALEPDIQGLRQRVTEGQRSIASRGVSGPHRGNNHKRIRIAVDLNASPTDMPALLTTLRGVDRAPAPVPRVYRPASPNPVVGPSDLFTFDPESRERGLAAHARTQNELAAHVESMGLVPFSPAGDEPDFDIAWYRQDTLYVAEVKSLSELNVTQQLRLGLGQVLQYRTLLRRSHSDVAAVLAVESDPGGSWLDTCVEVGVLLTWPAAWGGLSS